MRSPSARLGRARLVVASCALIIAARPPDAHAAPASDDVSALPRARLAMRRAPAPGAGPPAAAPPIAQAAPAAAPNAPPVLDPAATDITEAPEAPEAPAPPPRPRQRVSSKPSAKPIAAAFVGVSYAAVSTWAYFAWFHNAEHDGMGVTWSGFGVHSYAGGADKLGHAWSSMVLTRATTEVLVYGGWPELGSSLVAAGLSQAFFTVSEYEDSLVHQFEIADIIANLSGAGLSILFDNVPELDRLLDFRLEYFPSDDYRRTFSEENNIDFAQDYSGQSYMLALHLGAVPGLTEARWTRWASFADVVVGFESRNYMPAPEDPRAAPTQRLYLGVALDVNAVLRGLFADSIGRDVAHGVFENVSIPYTTWKALDVTRSQ